jgi:hypothetical protein
VRTSAATAALSGMHPEFSMALTNPARLALTEAALASADRLWRDEMRRNYGTDGVLAYGSHRKRRATSVRRFAEPTRPAVSRSRCGVMSGIG